MGEIETITYQFNVSSTASITKYTSALLLNCLYELQSNNLQSVNILIKRRSISFNK